MGGRCGVEGGAQGQRDEHQKGGAVGKARPPRRTLHADGASASFPCPSEERVRRSLRSAREGSSSPSRSRPRALFPHVGKLNCTWPHGGVAKGTANHTRQTRPGAAAGGAGGIRKNKTSARLTQSSGCHAGSRDCWRGVCGPCVRTSTGVRPDGLPRPGHTGARPPPRGRARPPPPRAGSSHLVRGVQSPPPATLAGPSFPHRPKAPVTADVHTPASRRHRVGAGRGNGEGQPPGHGHARRGRDHKDPGPALSGKRVEPPSRASRTCPSDCPSTLLPRGEKRAPGGGLSGFQAACPRRAALACLLRARAARSAWGHRGSGCDMSRPVTGACDPADPVELDRSVWTQTPRGVAGESAGLWDSARGWQSEAGPRPRSTDPVPTRCLQSPWALVEPQCPAVGH